MKARNPLLITVIISLVVLGAALLVRLQGVAQAGDKSQGRSQPPTGGLQAPACGPNYWTVVDSPNPSPLGVRLTASAVVDAGYVWAVGYTIGDSTHGVTELWNGTNWSVVASPRASLTDDRLYAVAASSTNDAWAVGQYFNGTYDESLVEHWDGISWSIVASPSEPGGNNLLAGVTVASTGDVWAAGSYYDFTSDAYRTLTEHWDGTSWSVVASANANAYDNALTAVAVVSPQDVWAVGYYSASSTGPGQTLTEHWNGTDWGIVSSPSPGTFDNALEGVAVASGSDVWAVGYYANASGNQRSTLALHWAGQGWDPVSSLNPGTIDNIFSAVAVASSSDVWAVGSFTNGGGVEETLVEHWDGASWGVKASPNQGSSVLNGVAVASATDVWAVGEHSNPNPTQTLVEHWDGTGWTITPNSDQTRNNELYGLAKVSVSDLWAVGVSNDGPGINARALIEHWDGTAWSIVPGAPDPLSAESSSLNSVSALSANDVWAVGSYYNGTSLRTLVEHWDGTAWSVAGSPNETTNDNALLAVAAVNATDVWAVGYFTNASNYRETLSEYWNGTDWIIAATPNVGTGDNTLTGAAALSAFDVWAVGYYKGPIGNQTLIEHWNGFAWSLKTSGNAGSGDNFLTAVSPIASTNAWAVGYYENEGHKQALIEHWTASGWSVVASPPVGGSDNYLLGVAAVSANDVWAVGYDDNGTVKQTLVEHWDGSAWTVVNSSNAGTSDNYLRAVGVTYADDIWAVGDYNTSFGTGTLTERYTPCTPTATATPTLAASPTACTIQFSDVPVGSTFYEYIHCLACLGIINGYTSGCDTGSPCFKPNYNVTRGQLSKIVSNAAGFNDPEPDQLFQDVPVGSDFFTYTARLASRGLISGYPCGLPIEPCGPAHLPYFRPGRYATRGQIAKIVSNAAGFNDTPSGPLYQDVAPGSAFYTFTYRLGTRHIVNGYPCGIGGPSEPCVPPGNLPYYRPNNNATRGQIAKIVSITFFPDCNIPSRP